MTTKDKSKESINRPPTLTEQFSQAKDEKALIKKIAEHEAYSAAYKLKLVGIVASKAVKIAAKGALLTGKGAVAIAKQIKTKREANRKDW